MRCRSPGRPPCTILSGDGLLLSLTMVVPFATMTHQTRAFHPEHVLVAVCGLRAEACSSAHECRSVQ